MHCSPNEAKNTHLTNCAMFPSWNGRKQQCKYRLFSYQFKSDAEAKQPRRHITSIAPCKAESPPCRSDLAVFRKFVRSMWSDNCRADGQACVWRQSAPLSYASSSHCMCIQSQAKTCKSRYQVDHLHMSIPWTPHVYSPTLVAMIK